MSAELALLKQIKTKRDMYAIPLVDFNPHTMLDVSGMFLNADLSTGGDKKIVLDIEEPAEYISTINNVDPFDDDSGVALYKFDDNTLDESGNYHGTNNGITFTLGKFDQSGIFQSSSDDYVSTSIIDMLDGTKAYSITFWMNSAGNIGAYDDFIVGNGDNTTNGFKIGCAVFIEVDGKLSFSRRDGVNSDEKISTPASVCDSTWKHIGIVFTGSHKYIYINGVDSTNGSSTLSATNNPLKLGTYSIAANTDEYYNGSLDQFRLFNKALTVDEVQILFQEKVER